MARDGYDQIDEESTAIIYSGGSVRQLSIMFKSDPAVITRKLGGLVPCGRRHGTNIYSIKEAAERLVEPGYSIERYIMEMNHTDLPPLLSKEFWNSQIARTKFEEMNGDLFRTADVVRIVAELLTTYRFVAQTLPDTLEREAGLTREQKATVRRVLDGALADGRDKIIARFKTNGRVDEFEQSVEQSELHFDPRLLDGRIADEDEGGTGVSGAEEDSDEYNGL